MRSAGYGFPGASNERGNREGAFIRCLRSASMNVLQIF